MFLAVAALLLQFAPVPQAVASAPEVSAATIASSETHLPTATDPTAADTASAPPSSTIQTIDNANVRPQEDGTRLLAFLEPDDTKLVPDLGSAHFKNKTLFSTESSSTNPLDPSRATFAQNSQSLSTIRIPAFEPSKQNGIVRAEYPGSRRAWLGLSLIQHGAAAFDAYTTRAAISQGAVETDPIMRPFAHSASIYAAIQAGPLVLDFVARRMQRSPNSFVRRMWWLPQSVATAGFVYSGVHNLHVAGNP